MEKYVDCYTGCIENGKAYIPSLTWAMLLEYDLISGEQRCLADFTDLFKERPMWAEAVFKKEECIYLVFRDNAFCILEYSLKTGQVVFTGGQGIYKEEEMLRNAFCIGDEIWLISENPRKNIWIFNMKSREFTELPTSLQINEHEGLQKLAELYFVGGCVFGDSIYLPVFATNFICQIIYKEKIMKIWSLEENFSIYTISSYEGELWLSDFKNPEFPKLYRWEREQQIVLETIELGKARWRENDILRGICFLREIIAYHEKLIVIPRYSNEITVIDRTQNSQRKLAYPDGFRRVMGSIDREMFRGLYVQDEYVFLFPCACNGILILNMETEKLELRELCLNKEDYRKYYRIYFEEKSKKEPCFFEGESISYYRGEFLLSDYIEQVKPSEGISQAEAAKTSGRRIYDFLTDRKGRGENGLGHAKNKFC